MENLMYAFSPVSLQEWKEKIALDLKGKTFESLSSRERNGILVAPFYNRENGRQEGALSQSGDWDIVSRIVVDDTIKSNKNALTALEQGASGIIFEIAATDNLDLTMLLKDIDYPYIFLAFDLKQETAPEYWKNVLDINTGSAPTQKPFFFYDPLGNQLATATAGFAGPNDAYIQALENLSPFSGIAVDGRRYHNAGANSSTQLAAVLAHCNEYLNTLKESGKLELFQNLQIRMATGTLFFEEIAKLRALRKLLPLIEDAYGVTLNVHLHISAGMLHRAPVDIHNNLLRDTIAGMAAILGGCNSLEIPAFDQYAAGPSGQGDRLSRNQQLIFKEESYLNCVADAAAGSFYLDQLTETLAETAWEAFKQLEAQGGFAESIHSGRLPEAIAKQAESLVREYRSGKTVLVGINKFPNPEDPPRKREKSKKEAIIPELNLCEYL